MIDQDTGAIVQDGHGLVAWLVAHVLPAIIVKTTCVNCLRRAEDRANPPPAVRSFPLAPQARTRLAATRNRGDLTRATLDSSLIG
jgi:hypothetical protein